MLAAPVLLALLVLATGCGGSADSSGSSSGGSTSAADSSGATAEAPQAPSGKSPDVTATSLRSTGQNAVAPISRAIVSTGEISLHSSTVASARADVVRLVASWGGTVADEQTESDTRGRITDSEMTLRVPSVHFDTAMNGLARVAHVEHQSRTSKDVTTQVIDNKARVRAAQRSIRAIESLLDRATKLSDVISIESDLARRQADLDSLEQQEAWLSDQTSLSTITVHLFRTVPPVPEKKETHGFLTGLGHGWSALQSSTVAALTVVGAVLPFGVVVLLVGVPLWLVVRRRRPVAAPTAEA